MLELRGQRGRLAGWSEGITEADTAPVAYLRGHSCVKVIGVYHLSLEEKRRRWLFWESLITTLQILRVTQNLRVEKDSSQSHPVPGF